MKHVDVIAVVGACAPERARYADHVASATGRRLLPATRLVQSMDPIDEAVVVTCATDAYSRAVVEFPSTTSAVELIGALTDSMLPLELSDVVCVADAAHLLDDLAADDFVASASTDFDGDIEYTARALLTVTQIEYASLVVLVNWETMSTPDLSMIMALVSHLSPHARLRLFRGSEDAPAGASPYTAAQDRAGWISVLNGEFDPHMTDPRVSAFRYEQIRPFHPERLKNVLDERVEPGGFGSMVRSSGFCRLATRPRITAQWEHVGRTLAFHPISTDDSIGVDDEAISVGQDLAIVGLDLDSAGLAAALDAASLTDAEFAAGPAVWTRFRDPFPAWPTVTERTE